MFLPNLDGDAVDAPGRREDGCGGSGRGRRTAAGLLTLGWWCTGRAGCFFSSFGCHFGGSGGGGSSSGNSGGSSGNSGGSGAGSLDGRVIFGGLRW